MGAVSSSPYKGHWYPEEIISRCVWLYHRFPLRVREIEEMMLARGVVVCNETIRRRCQKFGQIYANELRRRRPQPDDKWHLARCHHDQWQAAAPGVGGRPGHLGHRQASQLRCGPPTTDAQRGTPSIKVSE